MKTVIQRRGASPAGNTVCDAKERICRRKQHSRTRTTDQTLKPALTDRLRFLPPEEQGESYGAEEGT